ncbi:hypothetical protein M011DRAFT_481084 [Sporormia fimetaria CBS 119925]|uniref:Uncharacterized protein n=1 Tax=Sporormia fimetaria CBS 119925 TaxID=1340428 RepID=A0A6A6UZG6_9PLEO|nr:hypothetical protein M011DRAFT_481084 [Sporormia fimetaria CBS 119925]
MRNLLKKINPLDFVENSHKWNPGDPHYQRHRSMKHKSCEIRYRAMLKTEIIAQATAVYGLKLSCRFEGPFNVIFAKLPQDSLWPQAPRKIIASLIVYEDTLCRHFKVLTRGKPSGGKLTKALENLWEVLLDKGDQVVPVVRRPEAEENSQASRSPFPEHSDEDLQAPPPIREPTFANMSSFESKYRMAQYRALLKEEILTEGRLFVTTEDSKEPTLVTADLVVYENASRQRFENVTFVRIPAVIGDNQFSTIAESTTKALETLLEKLWAMDHP